MKNVCCRSSMRRLITRERLATCLQCEKWQQHSKSATESRLHYRSDAERDLPEDTSIRSVDLQKVIMLPRLPGVKSAVFTRRIVAYHETFASVEKKTTKRRPSLLFDTRGLQGEALPK